jgi:cytochrome c55X
LRKILSSLLATVLMITAVAAAVAEITPGRQAELIYLLRQDCGSCHGMRLSGGLGPALLPERMQLWEVNQLAATILQGRPGTPMPPWQPFLTDQEAVWLATQLQQGIQP